MMKQSLTISFVIFKNDVNTKNTFGRIFISTGSPNFLYTKSSAINSVPLQQLKKIHNETATQFNALFCQFCNVTNRQREFKNQ